MDEAMLGFVDGAVDVTHSRVEERGESSGSLDRGFDQALTSPEQARKPTVLAQVVDFERGSKVPSGVTIRMRLS